MPDSNHAYDIFFIYHPDDLGFLRHLAAQLEAQGLRFWLDENEYGADEAGRQRLMDGILRAYSVAMILTPSSAESQLCNTLIEFAVINSKRFVTLVVNEDIAADVHPAVAANAYIFFREADNFEVSLASLIGFLPADEHMRYHTDLLVLASNWDQQGRGHRLLLPPDQAERARLWLLEGSQRAPKPSQQQVAFIHASRRQKPAPKRSLTRYLIAAIAALIIVGGLAFVLQNIMDSQVAATATAAYLGTVEAQREADLALGSTATAQSNSSTRMLAALAATSGSIAREIRGTGEAQIEQATRQAAAAMTAQVRATQQAADQRATEAARRERERAAKAVLDAAETALNDGHFEMALALAWDIVQTLEQPYPAYPLLRRIAALSPQLTLKNIAQARIQPGGQQLAVIPRTFDRVSVYNWDSGQLLYEIRDHQGELTAIDYSRNGAVLVTAAKDGELVIRESDTGVAKLRLAAHDGPISAIALSNDGARVFSAGQDSLLAAWDIESGAPLEQYNRDFDEFGAPTKLLVSEDDSRLIAWFDNDGGAVMAQWAADNLDLLTADTGGRVYLGADPRSRLAYTGGRSLPAYAGDPNTGEVRFWELDTGQPAGRLSEGFNWTVPDDGSAAATDGLSFIAFRGEDALLGLEDSAGGRRAVLVNLADPTVYRTLEYAFDFGLTSAHFIAPKTLISPTDDGRLVLWSSADGSFIRQIGIAPEPIQHLTVSDDNEVALGQTQAGGVTVWGIAAGAPQPLQTFDAVDGMALDRSGGSLLIVDGNDTRLLDVASGEILRQIEGGRLTRMNDSGRHFALVDDEAIVVYDASNGERLTEWPSPVDEVLALHVSPAGRVLVNDASGGLHLLKPDSAQALQLDSEGAGPLEGLRFSNQAAFLTVHADRALLWDGVGSSPAKVFSLGVPAGFPLDERFDAAFDPLGDSLSFFARLDNHLAGITVISLDGELIRRQTFVDVAGGFLNAEGGELLLHDLDGRSELVNALSGAVLHHLEPSPSQLRKPMLRRSANRLFAMAGGQLLVWDLRTGVIEQSFYHSDDLVDFSIDAGGDLALTRDGAGVYRLWQVESRAALLARVEADLQPRPLTCSERDHYQTLRPCE